MSNHFFIFYRLAVGEQFVFIGFCPIYIIEEFFLEFSRIEAVERQACNL